MILVWVVWSANERSSVCSSTFKAVIDAITEPLRADSAADSLGAIVNYRSIAGDERGGSRVGVCETDTKVF